MLPIKIDAGYQWKLQNLICSLKRFENCIYRYGLGKGFGKELRVAEKRIDFLGEVSTHISCTYDTMGYFMAMSCISLIFSHETLYFPKGS